jgi:hypothetical protein
MAYTFNLDGSGDTLQIALVRDEIDDVSGVEDGTEGTDYFLSDARITARLTSALEESPDAGELEVRLLAAASCLDTLATNQAYVLKKQRTLGQETDGAAVADAIRAHAASLRKRAAAVKAERDATTEATAWIDTEPYGGTVALVPTF